MYRFSIVTPSYNMGAWLRLCVASVADQEGVEVEHIVCDGGSADGTVEWLRELTGAGGGAKSGGMSRGGYRLRWVSESDGGMYDAINKGLRMAEEEICAYLNCDEQYLPGALRAAGEYLAGHGDVDVAVGDAVFTDVEGGYRFHREMLIPSVAHIYVAGIQLLTCGLFFRREILDQEGLYFDVSWRALADAVWAIEALRKGVRFGLMREFTSIFTDTGSNLYLGEEARSERRKFLGMAPWYVWRLRHGIVLWFRLRRFLAGHYRPKKTAYSIYTQGMTGRRTPFIVDRSSFRCVTSETGFWPSGWGVLKG